MNASIAAVVVTYNRRKLLLESIECLFKQKPFVPSIIVIDNHSSDGTKDALMQYIETGKIIYCDTEANIGGAGGFWFGIKFAVKNGYDYVWLMDDDCMPKNDTLAAFMLADKDLNGIYGFLSSKVLWQDGTICAMNLQRKTLTQNLRNFDKQLQKVVMASFVSLFIPVKIVKDVGLPIKEFFIWTDDWEFTRRISRKYPCYAVSDSVVIHKSCTNVGANIATASIERLDRFDYLYRNDVFLYKREGLVGFSYEIFRILYHCAKVLIFSPNKRFKRIMKVLIGTYKGLYFKPEIEYV